MSGGTRTAAAAARRDENSLEAGAWRGGQPYPTFRAAPTIVTPDRVVGGEPTIGSPEEAARIARALEPVKQRLFEGLERGFRYCFPGAAAEPREPIHWRP